jgi:hypothetical protein
MRPLIPAGNSVRDQIRSILPKKLNKYEKDTLSYALSRIVIERIPRLKKLPVVMIGLDTLTAAILSIYNISKIVNQRVAWLYSLWFYKIEQIKIRAIEHILDAVSGGVSWEDIVTEIEQVDKLINEALGQDPNLDSSIVQQDNQSKMLNEWRRNIESRDSNDYNFNKNFRTEVSEALAMLKGFSAPLEKEIDISSISATRSEVLAIRADGPIASKYERLLQLFRQEINIIGYDPLVKLCLQSAKQERHYRITARDLEEVSQFKGRTAYYELGKLEYILHERYIPSLRRIGLRYRYIFTPRQRPGVVSDGLVERLFFIEQNIRGCSVHIEPCQTKGPNNRMFPEGSFEAVVEDEIISMCLDGFDKEKSRWSLNSIISGSRSNKRGIQVIKQSTASVDNRQFGLTERQIELLSILWRFSGSRTERRWLLNQIDFPTRTANRMLHKMLHADILKLVYLPALEFCRLPDGLMIVANCFDRRSRDGLIRQLVEQLPYVRILFGDSNDVVAHARLPAMTSDKVGGPIRQMMKEISDRSFTARVKSSYTYNMTALHRIRNIKTKDWKDPWLI